MHRRQAHRQEDRRKANDKPGTPANINNKCIGRKAPVTQINKTKRSGTPAHWHQSDQEYRRIGQTQIATRNTGAFGLRAIWNTGATELNLNKEEAPEHESEKQQ